MPIMTQRRIAISLGTVWPTPSHPPGLPFGPDIRVAGSRHDDRAFTVQAGDGPPRPLNDGEAARLAELLAAVSARAPWSPAVGFDGITYELTIIDDLSSMVLSWWVKPPPEWTGVAELTAYVESLV